MTSLEQQLQASIDFVELRTRPTRVLVEISKAISAELVARKAKLRKDAADLKERRRQLQRDAADLTAAGLRVKPRIERKDKGSRRAKPTLTIVQEVSPDVAELNALDVAAANREADEEYERTLFDSGLDIIPSRESER